MNKNYSACLYLRISKEDDDEKKESNSITNQRELIHQYLKQHDDITVVAEMVDDGYSGADFNRPNLQKMLKMAENGLINCVIFKDLSRFARDYILCGNYLEKIFPRWGVRYISVNENLDSLKSQNGTDNMLTSVQSLMNDAYCRDISIKIRSNRQTQRINGEFIGSFSTYGYFKNPDDRHSLIPDNYAAEVVNDIFQWKLEGMSQQGIADRLNDLSVLSPLEYKKYLGTNYTTSFKQKAKSLWSAVAIGRILKNEVYIGNLVQGKRSTPNHKVKKIIFNPESEWVRIQNRHEAIISPKVFQLVQELLSIDTRVAPNKKEVYLFSGLLYCADCGEQLIRSSSKKLDGKSYSYYMCGTNRTKKECSSHRVSEQTVEEIVLHSLQKHVQTLLDLEKILDFIEDLPLKTVQADKYNQEIKQCEEELVRCYRLKTSAFEHFSSGIIDEIEYKRLVATYEQSEYLAKSSLSLIQEEFNKLVLNPSEQCQWIQDFKSYGNIKSLNRKMLVTLVEKVTVYEDKRLEITFHFQAHYARLQSYLQAVATEHPLPAYSQEVFACG